MKASDFVQWNKIKSFVKQAYRSYWKNGNDWNEIKNKTPDILFD